MENTVDRCNECGRILQKSDKYWLCEGCTTKLREREMIDAEGRRVRDGDVLWMVHTYSWGMELSVGRCVNGKYRDPGLIGPTADAYLDRDRAIRSKTQAFGVRVKLHGDNQAYASVYIGDVKIAFASVQYSATGAPMPTTVQWRGVVGLPEMDDDLRLAIEKIILLNARENCCRDDARIAGGREMWRTMSRDERDALNRYALECEGHTID